MCLPGPCPTSLMPNCRIKTSLHSLHSHTPHGIFIHVRVIFKVLTWCQRSCLATHRKKNCSILLGSKARALSHNSFNRWVRFHCNKITQPETILLPFQLFVVRSALQATDCVKTRSDQFSAWVLRHNDTIYVLNRAVTHFGDENCTPIAFDSDVLGGVEKIDLPKQM